MRVVLSGAGRSVRRHALFDTGAQVSVMEAAVAKQGRWPLMKTRLQALVGVGDGEKGGGNRQEVLGVVQAEVEVQGVKGVVSFAVVRSIGAKLPDVVLGRSALIENQWQAVVDAGGVTLREVEQMAAASMMRTMELNVVTTMDEDGEETVVYGAPAYEDVTEEEDGDEVEYMPPPEKEREEVINDILKKVDPLELEEELKDQLGAMLKERWRALNNKIGGVRGYEFAIEVEEGTKAVSRPMFRYDPEQTEEIKRQSRELLERGLIEPCKSRWSTSVVLAKKKDGTKRMAVDYRGLNKVTKPDRFPAPRIDDLLDDLAEYRVFSTLDMRWGYWQMPLREEDRDKTAFATPDGLYRWKVMPFGLRNATGAFQRMMTEVLADMKGVKVYVDDVVVGTVGTEGHVELLSAVLKRIEDAGLVCKLSKCEFMKSEVEVLGFVIGGGKVGMQERMEGKVLRCREPETKSEVRQFVGMTGFYRHFIDHFAERAAPLTDVMGAVAEWKWGEEQKESFEDLKDAVLESPVLRAPDLSEEFVLHTDASGIGIGAALMQRDPDGRLYVCRFYSRKLEGAQRRYSATEREYLAVVLALKQWRKYLSVKPSEVHTDHKPLLTMVQQGEQAQSARVQRWGTIMQAFDVRVRYIKGKANVVADALSRELFMEREPEVSEEAVIGAMTRAELEEPVEPVKGGEPDMEKSDVPGDAGLEVEPDGVAAEIRDAQRYWEEMKVAQKRDQECARWLEKLEQGGVVKKDGGEVFLDDGVLMFRDNEGRKRLVVPSSKRAELLRLVHENQRDGGHFGARKGAHKLRPRWWWPTMITDLRQWVSGCQLCQFYKHQRGRTKLPADTPRVIPAMPWDSVFVDAVGPVTQGDGSYRYLLVAIDHFTRWVELMPTRRLTTELYVGWLRQLIDRWGVMRRLTTDRGSNFVSKLVEEFCKALEIEQHKTTAWRPTANSLVERYNGELKQRLMTYCEENGKKWPGKTDDWACAHNTTVHAMTGHTPFFLMHGREMPMAYDWLLKARGKDEPQSIYEYRTHMVRTLEDSYAAARANQGDKEHERRVRLDTVVKVTNPPPQFKEGDRVLLQARHRLPGEKKDATRVWRGPYRVLEKVSDVTYVILKEGREDEVHVDRLKRWKPPGDLRERDKRAREAMEEDSSSEESVGEVDVWEDDEPAESKGEDDEEADEAEEALEDEDVRAQEEEKNEYEVEQVLESRLVDTESRVAPGKRREFLIKWKNWGGEHNSWEKEANLEMARDAVKQFLDVERARRMERRAARAEAL